MRTRRTSLIRDPKILIEMIIVPVILFTILGATMSFSMQSAQETAQKTVVLVINQHNGDNSSQFISYLNTTLKIVPINASNVDQAIPLLAENNTTEIIEIPPEFSQMSP